MQDKEKTIEKDDDYHHQKKKKKKCRNFPVNLSSN